MMLISRGGRVSALLRRGYVSGPAPGEALMSSIVIGTYVAPLIPPGQREIEWALSSLISSQGGNVLSLREFRGSGEANRAK
jgi:hypothetical protein